MERPREAAGPSRPTQTITLSSAPETSAGTLRLRGQNSDARRVKWTNGTVDNEHLGRKSSKICCIYHKPKKFDESSSDSSSESDSQDTGDEHDVKSSQKLKRKIQEKKARRQEQESCCHEHEHEHAHGSSSSEDKAEPVDSLASSRNAYEKGVK